MKKGEKLFGEIASLRAKAKRATGAKRILAQEQQKEGSSR